MRINDMLLEATHPLFETVLPSYHPAVRLGEDLARTLTEAALTVDQIAQLFAQVEKDVSAKGGNRTILGKGVDAAKFVKKCYDWTKDLAEKGGQVVGFEKAYDKVAQELKNASGGDTGAVMRYIEKYRSYAKENPLTQKAIYGAIVLAAGVAGSISMGPAYIVLKPAVLGVLKFVDSLIKGEGITKSAIAGGEAFLAVNIAQGAVSALRDMFSGGIPTPPNIPAVAAAATAATDVAAPDVPTAAVPEPDASKLPGGNTGMADQEIRAANMQSVSNDMEKNAPAAEPNTAEPAAKSIKIPSIANSTGTDILDAANEDPKVSKVLTNLTNDLDQKFAKIGSGKLGSEVLQNIQKDLMAQVDKFYPDDANLFLNPGQKKELVYQLMAKAQDSYIDSSPKLSGIVNDTTSKLFDKIGSGAIKTELDLDKFIRSEIIGQNPDLKSTPAITTMLTAKADSLLKTIYSDALDADPRFTKNPEWKIKAIKQYLSTLPKGESINFSRPALTESQVMEAFRGTMFHKDTLTESQVRKIFQQISEGPWGALQQVGGKIAQAAKQAGSAVAGSRAGQATAKATGSVINQLVKTGSNLANKVTADKLMSAWKSAGSKTDSNDIYEFLKSQGVDETILKDAFKAAGIKLTAARVSPQYKKLSAIVTKLSPEDQQKLIQYLQAA
jgi:hypothetical protein